MALTTQQLADALRLDAADAKIAGQLQRIQPPAEAAVLKFAPHAPEAIRDEATIRLAGYLYDAPTVPQPGVALTTAPLRQSGAAGLLAPYRRHRLGLAGAPERAQPGLVPGAPVGIDEDAVNALITAALAPYATTQALNAAIAGIMPSEGGGGLTSAQAASLARLMVFEAGMKRGVILGTAQASITQAVSGASASIPGNPILPANRFDREILVSVGTFQGRFYIKDLENLGGVSTIGAQLTGANAIEFTDSVAAAKYFVSFHTADRALLFAADTSGTYRITLSDYDIDLEDFARRSTAERLPIAKAPLGFLDITHLERLLSVSNAGVQANDQVLFYDASAEPGQDQIREISFAQLDRRWLLLTAADARIDGRIAPWARTGQTAPSGGGASAFTGLSDTPSALGNAGQHVAVDSAGTALEFVAPPSGGGGATTFAGLTGRILERQLPQDLDDILDAVEEGGWKAWPAAALSGPHVSKVARATINQRGLTFTAKYDNPSGTAQPNAWFAIRVANADVANVPSARIGSRDSLGGLFNVVDGKDWELIENTTVTGFTFYNAQITPQIPGDDDVEIERYNQFAIDTTKVRTLPAGGAAGQYVDFTGAWKDLPRPQRGLRILQDGNLAGLSLTNLNSDVVPSNLTLLNPAFDLDTAGNGNGEFHAELTLTVGTRSANSIGFTPNALGSAPSRTVTGLAFSTTLAAATAYASTSSPGGVILGQASLYSGTTVVGTIILRLGRNAQNQVGLFLEYDGAGAGATGNASIAARLELSFTPSDAPAGAAPSSFLGLTDTPGAFTGQGGRFVAVNAGASALAFVAAPGAPTVSFIAGSATATRRIGGTGIFGNRIPVRTNARTLYNWLTGTRDMRDFILVYWLDSSGVTSGPGYPIQLYPYKTWGAGAITMRGNSSDIRFWLGSSSSQYYLQTTTISNSNISGSYFGLATVSH